MSVEIKLYQISDPHNKLVKSLPENPIATVKGQFVGEYSDVNPNFLFQGSINNVNYAYVNGFYYWVDDPIIERDGLTRLVMHRDPLMSFADQIRNCPMVAERSSNQYNAFVPDNQRAFKSYTKNVYHSLGSFKPTMDTWLITAG